MKLSLCALFSAPLFSFCQARLSGIVSGPEGLLLQGISVRLNNAIATSTDNGGAYFFNNVKNGKYEVSFSGAGFQTIIKQVIITESLPVITLSVKLHALNNQLNEVQVKSKTAVQTLREQPQNLTVIDTRFYYNRPNGALNLINQASGVKVRQNGGLGSNADYYINGLSGKQVKFFIDGIPLDFLGSNLNINILPVNIIDRVEIYKGVVPVKLGADALGGAIDVITRRNSANYMDASYEISSFNTHRASLNLYRNFRKKFFVDVSGFYNYSDNNYHVDVTVPDAFGTPQDATVSRFHDRFHNVYSRAAFGAKQIGWADELSVFTSFASGYQQIQNNLTMTQPYGKVAYSENSWNNGIKYNKTWRKFSVDIFGGINQIHQYYVDTSLNTYNWYGQVVARRSSNGESFGPLQDTRTDRVNRLMRIGTSYEFNRTARIDLNLLTSSFDQNENNPATASYPVKLTKFTGGLAFTKTFLEEKLTSITSVKFYRYKDNGYQFNSGGGIGAAQASSSRGGWNEALRYMMSPEVAVKASYELAARLPDENELFGSYLQRTRPNPALKPEISNNLNAGLQYFTDRSRFEVNGFYRLADNLIYAPPSAFFLLYQNLLKVQVTGLEAEYSYKFFTNLKVIVNGTYQSIINKTSAENSGEVGGGHYDLRLPNIPFLFSNGELQYSKKGILNKGDLLSAWYNAGYVHWFYLYWANDGSAGTKAIIPSQYLQNTGISYALPNDRYALSFEVQNLADAKVFDNYGLQRPGRSFHLKIRTFIR